MPNTDNNFVIGWWRRWTEVGKIRLRGRYNVDECTGNVRYYWDSTINTWFCKELNYVQNTTSTRAKLDSEHTVKKSEIRYNKTRPWKVLYYLRRIDTCIVTVNNCFPLHDQKLWYKKITINKDNILTTRTSKEKENKNDSHQEWSKEKILTKIWAGSK